MIEAMSTDAEQIYECDLCTLLLCVPADINFSDIQGEFDGHECNANSLKNKVAGTKNTPYKWPELQPRWVLRG
jgi:hypothetical protein